MKHELWLWVWFGVGTVMYWIKRAYYLISGPNPVANNVSQFVRRCWAPLLVRAFADSLMFWSLFTPGFADRALNYFGWTSFAWVVQMVTQFAVFAACFGYTVDSVMDFALSKIPGVNQILPQMPGPLPPAAPAPAQP